MDTKAFDMSIRYVTTRRIGNNCMMGCGFCLFDVFLLRFSIVLFMLAAFCAMVLEIAWRNINTSFGLCVRVGVLRCSLRIGWWDKKVVGCDGILIWEMVKRDGLDTSGSHRQTCVLWAGRFMSLMIR
jgi:hypothetical protein